MGEKSKRQWTKVLLFAAVYLLVQVISVVFFTIGHIPSSELSWYLQRPWQTLTTMLFELIRNPLLMLSLLTMMLESFVLGVVTDWVLSTLRRRILLWRRKQNILES